ncbi:MAG: hypothetical protein V4772_02335 [Pseudomonadota bacterium]
MSLPAPVLQSLQQAGQGVHNATVQIAEAVKSHGLKVVSSIANDPFSSEGEKAFGQLRTLARLGRELNGVEEKLRELYQLAEQLSASELTAVLVALAPAAKEVSSSSNSAVQDVVAKTPAKTATRLKPKAPAKAPAKAPVKALVKPSAKAAAKAPAKTVSKAPAKTAVAAPKQAAAAPAASPAAAPAASATRPLSGNDAKILDTLKKSLSRKSWTNMTHSAIGQAAGVPSGSIGISLKRLIQAGKLAINPAGAYQLGAD